MSIEQRTNKNVLEIITGLIQRGLIAEAIAFAIYPPARPGILRDIFNPSKS
jgi:hypothetical protein